MALQIILIGDQTTHGGSVITASDSHTVGGRGIARLGDLVSCPEHGVNKIVEAHPTFSVGDKRVALHGHRTECGCTLIGSVTANVGD